MKALLCAAAILLVLPACTQAQSPLDLSEPLIKLGLWHTSGTEIYSSTELTPQRIEQLKTAGKAFPGGYIKHVDSLSCVTRENWKSLTAHQENAPVCETKNEKMDGSVISFDLTCRQMQATAVGQTRIDIFSKEKDHVATHFRVSGVPLPPFLDIIAENDYAGADCQGVSPDQPKLISAH